MIKLEVIPNTHSHFVIRADEPMRVETTMKDGRLTTSVYLGTHDDPEQTPIGVYDSEVANDSWRSYPCTAHEDCSQRSFYTTSWSRK